VSRVTLPAQERNDAADTWMGTVPIRLVDRAHLPGSSQLRKNIPIIEKSTDAASIELAFSLR
jgi:hypothetical protein